MYVLSLSKTVRFSPKVDLVSGVTPLRQSLRNDLFHRSVLRSRLSTEVNRRIRYMAGVKTAKSQGIGVGNRHVGGDELKPIPDAAWAHAASATSAV